MAVDQEVLASSESDYEVSVSVDPGISLEVSDGGDQVVETGSDVVVVNTGGTDDYRKLVNKPSIESVTLVGNKTFGDLGVTTVTNQQILDLFR